VSRKAESFYIGVQYFRWTFNISRQTVSACQGVVPQASDLILPLSNASVVISSEKETSRTLMTSPLETRIYAPEVSSSPSSCPPEEAPPKTLIVIPAFNEERNIGRVIRGVLEYVPSIPLLVVNDGSSDRTAKIAKESGAEVISLPCNLGYGVALQTGFIYALQRGYTVIVQMDGDGQHDPSHIPDLLRELRQGDNEVVIGSRFLHKDKYTTTLLRQLGMNIFSQLASIFCGQRVTDPTSGFQALKGRAIHLVASGFYPPDYPDADFLILLHRCGIGMREIPVKMHPNPENKSMHNGHRSVYYVVKMFLSIFVTLLRQKPQL